MIALEIIQKAGSKRIHKVLPSGVAAVLSECVREAYQAGMAREFGGVLKVRVEFQHSALTNHNTAVHKGAQGLFYARYDLVEQRVDHEKPCRIVVNAGPAYDHRQIADTLAHEFGHLQDFMQNPDLYARKNWQKAYLLEPFAIRYAQDMLRRVTE